MIDALIGHTPTLRLARVVEPDMAEVWLKLEGMNPAGSIKDRTARAMVDDAEARGLLKPGGTIVEPTSGNTGIGLAQIAAWRGYRLILCMPSSMSAERKLTLAAYGAEIVLTDTPNAACWPRGRKPDASLPASAPIIRTSFPIPRILGSTTRRRVRNSGPT